MISDSGYDPSLAGGRGGYVLGSFQGGPDPNAGRDAIAQSVMAQQGMPPPQALQAPQGQGMNDARGPDQEAPFRQAIGNQGWSFAGNDVFDPSGAIVGRHGLQQYGAIPGLTPTSQSSGPGFNEIFPHSPTSSFDFATGLPSMEGGAPTATGRDAFSGTPAQDWGGVFDSFGNSPLADPTMSAPAMHSSPHATPTFDVDQNGMPNAPDVTPAAPNEGGSPTDPGAQGGFSGADFASGGFGGFGGFDAGGMGMDTAGGVG
jgi:hypothetical protein